jgi:hypothetical protein
MTKNQTPKRGGPRPGSGRTTDFLKRSQLLAIQLSLLCSESTARRHLRDNAGRIKGLVSPEHLDTLDGWENLSEFNQGFVYGYFLTRVGINQKQGFGVRL